MFVCVAHLSLEMTALFIYFSKILLVQVGTLSSSHPSFALAVFFFLFFESAFVVNSTNPMVLCERSFVAVAHTHTPRRTARPPTAPPRRERDEEMGQRRRKHKHVWEG